MNASQKPLGQLLQEAGYITPEQLRLVLREQQRTGELIGDIVVRLGFTSDERVSEILAQQSGVPHITLRDRHLPKQLATIVPEDLARRYNLVPIAKSAAQLTVALADFFNIKAIDHLTKATGLVINAVSASESEIATAIERLYSSAEISDISLEEELGKISVETNEESGAGPMARLVDRLIAEGVKRGATDIHIEPEEKIIRTRYRQDGMLLPGPSIPKELQAAIISRIKIMASMNIAETRLPQDGRIDFKVGKKAVDLRASSFPTLFGESLVLRILDRDQLVMGLENLGFSGRDQKVYATLIQKANGIILVTGPTGSGKTTSLYSTLLQINSLDKKIITLEDPIEYHFPMIQQAQINPKAGLTFATGLRAIFRQDPDIILIGEIRDQETVEMAIRAALTGHLVFSTLHTNDSASAISRLLDMNVEPYLLCSSVLAIVAQRLVRKLCSRCKRVVPVSPGMRERFQHEAITCEEIAERVGCETCNQTGFKGRIGIFEILVMQDNIKELVMARKSSDLIRDTAKRNGMTTMYYDGLDKVASKQTTFEEVIRVTQE